MTGAYDSNNRQRCMGMPKPDIVAPQLRQFSRVTGSHRVTPLPLLRVGKVGSISSSGTARTGQHLPIRPLADAYSRAGVHPLLTCLQSEHLGSRIEQISQVSVADFGCFMRVAHRKAPEYGIYGQLELLANFWQNGFLMTSPRKEKSENSRVYIGDLNGGPGWT